MLDNHLVSIFLNPLPANFEDSLSEKILIDWKANYYIITYTEGIAQLVEYG